MCKALAVAVACVAVAASAAEPVGSPDTCVAGVTWLDQTTGIIYKCNASKSPLWGRIAGQAFAVAVLTADRTNATTSYADIIDLSFQVAASTRYAVECVLPYSTNATTTGLGISWTGPASPTLTTAMMTTGITTQTTAGTVIAGNDTGATTTASVATTGNVARFVGIWSNGTTAGTLQLRFRSEVAVAGGIVVKAGAMCRAAVY